MLLVVVHNLLAGILHHVIPDHATRFTLGLRPLGVVVTTPVPRAVLFLAVQVVQEIIVQQHGRSLGRSQVGHSIRSCVFLTWRRSLSRIRHSLLIMLKVDLVFCGGEISNRPSDTITEKKKKKSKEECGLRKDAL